jgi:hypothetical protein
MNDIVLPAEIGAVRVGGVEYSDKGFRFRFGPKLIDVSVAAASGDSAPIDEGEFYPLSSRLRFGEGCAYTLEVLQSKESRELTLTSSTEAVADCNECTPSVLNTLFETLCVAESPDLLPQLVASCLVGLPGLRGCWLAWQDDDPRHWLQHATVDDPATRPLVGRMVAGLRTGAFAFADERPVHVNVPDGGAILLPLMVPELIGFFVLSTDESSNDVMPDVVSFWTHAHVPIARFVQRHRALREAARVAEENRYFRARERRRYLEKDIVAESVAMRGVVDAVVHRAADDSPVMLGGEAGTGKELLARALHHRGPRAAGMMVAVHCGERSPEALDEELFGLGGNQGGDVARRGLLELCDDGTLFLEEVHLLSSCLQLKLARVIAEGELTRLGESAARNVNVRIVAATHMDLSRLSDQGLFRYDLATMLTRGNIVVPPLRERTADLPTLVGMFVLSLARRYDKSACGANEESLQWLSSLQWPGNVRELMSLLEHAVLQAPADRKALHIEDFRYL